MEEYTKLLNKYRLSIKQFEDNIKNKYNNDKKNDPEIGFLVNLEDYENLKNRIITQSNRNISEQKKLENKTKLKTLEIKTSQYLNTNIWNLFGEEKMNNSFSLYAIDKYLIIFSLDDNILLKFNCWENNNIIKDFSFYKDNNKSCYPQLTSNFQKINKLYQQIIAYYNFEKEIVFYLSQNKTAQKKNKLGYLIEPNWLEKWKKKINYKEIKKNYEKSKDEKKLKDKIIFFNEINKSELPKIIVKKFGSTSLLQNYLKNNELALVNHSFIYYFDENTEGDILYNVFENSINLFIDKEISIKSSTNIITLKQDSINKLKIENNQVEAHLNIIINIYYYHEKIISLINSEHNKYENENNDIYKYLIS